MHTQLTRKLLRLDGASPLLTVLASVGLLPAEIAVALINRHPVRVEDEVLNDADRVDQYPPVKGGW